MSRAEPVVTMSTAYVETSCPRFIELCDAAVAKGVLFPVDLKEKMVHTTVTGVFFERVTNLEQHTLDRAVDIRTSTGRDLGSAVNWESRWGHHTTFFDKWKQYCAAFEHENINVTRVRCVRYTVPHRKSAFRFYTSTSNMIRVR